MHTEKQEKNPSNLDLNPMTLKFSGPLEVACKISSS